MIFGKHCHKKTVLYNVTVLSKPYEAELVQNLHFSKPSLICLYCI